MIDPNLIRLYAATPRELADQFQVACDALPAAAATAHGYVRDLDSAGLDALDQLAARLEGAAQIVRKCREALRREIASDSPGGNR